MKTNTRPKQMKIRVSAYGRYSCEQQSECSADDQINRIRHSIKNGLIPGRLPTDMIILEEWFIKDEALSGRTVVGRVGYERILQGIRQNSFDLLIVDDLSRLTRDLGNLLSLYEVLKWYGVELYSICDRVSSRDPNSKMYFTMRGMVNDFSNEVHAERVIRGMEMRAMEGYSTGHRPYGYKSEATRLTNAKGKPFPSHYKLFIDEDAAQNIRRIFAMYSTGEIGAVKIAKTLNVEGVTPPKTRGKRFILPEAWSPNTVRNILKNEKYIGIWQWKKTRVGIHPETKKRTAKIRPMNEWVGPSSGPVLEHLRIVDQDVWNIAQKLRAEKEAEARFTGHEGRFSRKKAGRLPEHPFSGILECAECASSYGLISGKGRGYYGCIGAHKKGICKNKQLIQIDRIEEGMFSLLGQNLCRPEIVEFAAKKYKEAFRGKLKQTPDRIQNIAQEVKKLEQEKENLILFIAQGKGTESINGAIREREIKIATLLNESNLLKKAQPQIKELTEEQIKARILKLNETIQKYPLECIPVVRRMFPSKVRISALGRAVGNALESKNLFSLKGSLHLNEGLAVNFESLVSKRKATLEKQKGAAQNGLPPNVYLLASKIPKASTPNCGPSGPNFQKFGMLAFGVTDGD